MSASHYRLSELDEDNPVALLHRKRIFADRVLFAQVKLDKGCHVPVHHHESEQVSYLVSGRLRWTLGEEGTADRRELLMEGGEVLQLPSHFPHGVDALEDCLIIDILSPCSEMGVDRMAADVANEQG